MGRLIQRPMPGRRAASPAWIRSTWSYRQASPAAATFRSFYRLPASGPTQPTSPWN